MATHRVRLFVLPYGHAATDAPIESPGFTVDSDNGDDANRELIRARLREWGYTIRSISALVGDKAAYVATVVSPKVKAAGVP